MSGLELRLRRLALGRVTQVAIAAELGVTREAIRQLEHRRHPRLGTVQRYLAALERLAPQ